LQNLTTKSVEALARTLGEGLLAANKKVSSVESCTGGGVAYAITEVAGSSQWFEKSWVTYSNQAKHEEVGVSLATLAKFGAVSSEVVHEMAEGGLRKSGANLCVAISGIAGPGGGTASKPVGLVWFAIAKTVDDRRANNGSAGILRANGLKAEQKNKIDNLHTKDSASGANHQLHTRCFSRCFSGDRQQVREQAVNLALKELIVSLVNT
jgi:nicotinamide-nucleotide amidase